MGTIKTTNIEPIADNGTVTLGSSGDTFTVPSGVTITNNGTQTGFGGANTPNFLVEDSTSQALANTTITKLSFGTETFDSDGAFASDKFTVPSGKAGKYFFYASWQSANTSDYNEQRIYLYKNGTAIDPNIQGYHDHYGSIQISKLVDLAVSDYIEVYAYQNAGGAGSTLGTSIFSGYKIIE